MSCSFYLLYEAVSFSTRPLSALLKLASEEYFHTPDDSRHSEPNLVKLSVNAFECIWSYFFPERNKADLIPSALECLQCLKIIVLLSDSSNADFFN